MALTKLADNDVLGNKASHFFKSGNIMRTKENDKLAQLRSLLPATGSFKSKLEYDIWYNYDEPEIYGYTYTDAMSKFIYLRVASTKKAYHNMMVAATEKITEEGEKIFEELKDNSCDKYRLRKKKLNYPFVIFLPGTNILDKVVDKEKVKRAVAQGACLKCHPLTAPGMVANLKYQFGADKIIDKKTSGHQLLEQASIVGCCKNSEMGLIGLAKGKMVYLFDNKNLEKMQTYDPLYNAVWNGTDYPDPNRLKSILSAKYSGLVPYFIDNPQERIEHFFTFWKGTKHNAIRNIRKQ